MKTWYRSVPYDFVPVSLPVLLGNGARLLWQCILSVLTSAYCTKYNDSYESAHLLSAGLYHYIHSLPAGSTAGTPDSSLTAPRAPPQYVHGTLDHSAPGWLSTRTEPDSLHMDSKTPEEKVEFGSPHGSGAQLEGNS